MPYVYLVQPAILKNTNRYKIGMSSLDDLSRVRSYKKGTRYLYIGECADAYKVEKKIISAFKSNYTLIGGKEYFEVDDELAMLNLFVSIVMNHKNGVDSPPKVKSPKVKSPEHNPPMTADSWMKRFAFTMK